MRASASALRYAYTHASQVVLHSAARTVLYYCAAVVVQRAAPSNVALQRRTLLCVRRVYTRSSATYIHARTTQYTALQRYTEVRALLCIWRVRHAYSSARRHYYSGAL